MNMKTALRKLYKAITGEDNYKTNYSKLLVDIHKALTDKYPTNKNNHAKIISELADNWTGSGGGGSSDFSTAQVVFVNDTLNLLEGAFVSILEIGEDQYACYAYRGVYESQTLTVPLYKGQAVFDSVYPRASGDFLTVEGDCEYVDGESILIIYGDCTVTLSHID